MPNPTSGALSGSRGSGPTGAMSAPQKRKGVLSGGGMTPEQLFQMQQYNARIKAKPVQIGTSGAPAGRAPSPQPQSANPFQRIIQALGG